MKTYTPQISWHDRQSILSVDIQNRLIAIEGDEESGTICRSPSYRLATGGNDSRVNIWRVSLQQQSNANSSAAETASSKKSPPIESIDCVAELTQHQRSVNIVRFSPCLDDNLLASGDDDSLIFVWKLCSDNTENNNSDRNGTGTKESADSRIEGDVIAVETWKPYKILRGHSQDVTDICWSSDGANLVSGSVDNNVFMWDVHRGTKLHKVAKEHCSYVQGVAWDPFNKYIASLSADRNMLVFNAKSGKTMHRVYKITFEENEKKTSSKLFFDQTLMSFCRRLTFSPNGELLFAPSGILENTGSDSGDYQNTIYIFERNSLNRPSFYLPTNKFSIAVSCCPVIFELKENVDNNFKFPYRIVFAVATQDSILLYDTQQLFPFAYITQIHYLRLTDLSWSPDGRILIATSTDGFSTFVTFDIDEIGTPYRGKLLELEELEPIPIAAGNGTDNSLTTKSAKKQNNAKNINTPSGLEKMEKEKIATPKSVSASGNIKSFFKRSTPSLASSPNATTGSSGIMVHTTPLRANQINQNQTTKIPAPKSAQPPAKHQPQSGRRISLITLFTPKSDENAKEVLTTATTTSSSPSLNVVVDATKREIEKSSEGYEMGVKRKLDSSDTEIGASPQDAKNVPLIQID